MQLLTHIALACLTENSTWSIKGRGHLAPKKQVRSQKTPAFRKPVCFHIIVRREATKN